MTTRSALEEEALRLMERQLESVGFELDANVRQTTVDIEKRLELLQRRKDLVKLYRMLGGEPAAIKEAVAQ